jgi:hypothetical protein
MGLTFMRIPGSEALPTLHARRAAYRATGEYPFLIGDNEELERLRDPASFRNRSPDDILRASGKVDLEQWLAERRAEADEWGFTTEALLGEWPDEISEKGELSLHRGIITGKTKPEVYLGIAPIQEPWHLPAIIEYGGWNACPYSTLQCAWFRKWQAEFGAEICGIGSDTIECLVAHPPQDRETATRLAWEQYWYCPDIVEQGCESISVLAEVLLNSPVWFFWWD